MNKKIVNRVCLVALCSWLAAACSEEKSDPSRVELPDGDVQGEIVGTDTQARQFLGIPYAKPPVGELRWKAPQKPEPWNNLRDATQFGKRCAQLMSARLQNAASDDEDCLYLNVWTPFPVTGNALPVMLWIHGGGNVNGSANEPVPFVNTGLFYTGQFLASNHGVVVVSINYRLGLFGFFEHPELTAEGSSGNQALLDQQMAMTWVRDNIARFGGDPANVTIFGESAGSFNVCMHVAAPSSRGLFHRAISQSGGCTTLQRSKPDAEKAGAELGAQLGCDGPGALACLRGKAAAELMKSPDVAAGLGFDPSVDGTFMPDQPRNLYDAGDIAKVPYLLGSNTDEGTLFLPAPPPTTNDQYLAILQNDFGATTAPQIAIAYPVSNFEGAMPTPPAAALARVIGDSRLVCTTFDTAVRAATAGSSVFLYNFDIAVVIPGIYLGATHGAELTSVFGTSPTFTAETRGASELMQRYWTNFARTGDPNGGSDPTWPAFGASSNVRLNLAIQPSVATDFRAKECAFWRAGYEMQFP
jgi:para-nitrobenzyl esterase